METSEGGIPQRSFFVPCDCSTFFFRLRVCFMDLLKACDEMKDFIGTAQKALGLRVFPRLMDVHSLS